MTDWIVLKFGGTSVSRRERWDTIGALMRRRAAEEGANVLVVVSALAGVTNALQAICDGHADPAGTMRRIDALVHRHEEACDELGLDRGVVRRLRRHAARDVVVGLDRDVRRNLSRRFIVLTVPPQESLQAHCSPCS